MATTNLGRVRFNMRGDYNPDADPLYSLLDLVSDGGGSFVYINETPSNEPTSSTSHWQQIASMGGQYLVDAAVAARDAAQGYKDAAANSAAQLQAGIGSPAGKFANLAAVNAANPAHDRTYLTEDDWKIALWDEIAQAFVAGGVYQALQGVDATLAQSGYAADAKVVGDILHDSAHWKKATGSPVSIYPVPNSKLSIKATGTYTQPGTNPPSPANLRPIAPWLESGAAISVAQTGGATIALTAPQEIPAGWLDNEGHGWSTYQRLVYDGVTSGLKFLYCPSWAKIGTTYLFQHGISAPATAIDNESVPRAACSHFPAVSKTAMANIGAIGVSTDGENLKFRIDVSVIAGWSDAWTEDQMVAAGNAWLAAQLSAETPLTLYYELATPVTLTPDVAPLNALALSDIETPRENVVALAGSGTLETTYKEFATYATSAATALANSAIEASKRRLMRFTSAPLHVETLSPAGTSDVMRVVGMIGAGEEFFAVNTTDNTLRHCQWEYKNWGVSKGTPPGVAATAIVKALKFGDYVYIHALSTADGLSHVYRAPYSAPDQVFVWSDSLWAGQAGSNVAMGPAFNADASYIYIGEYGSPAGDPCVYRSSDGVNWSLSLTGPSAMIHVHSVNADPYNPGHVWATFGEMSSGQNQCWFSDDYGATWRAAFSSDGFQAVQISFSENWVWFASDRAHYSALVVDRETMTPYIATPTLHSNIAVPGGEEGAKFYGNAFFGAVDPANEAFYCIANDSSAGGNTPGIFWLKDVGEQLNLGYVPPTTPGEVFCGDGFMHTGNYKIYKAQTVSA
jgi:hypothetical protein